MSKKSYFLAFIIAVCALLWIGSGFLKDSNNAETTDIREPSEEQELFQVRVSSLMAENYQQQLSLTGLTEAFLDVTVRSEIDGAVVNTPVAEGSFVKKDTVLFALALNDRLAIKKQAEAAVKQAEIEYKAASKLQKKGFGSDVRLATAQANLDGAQATLERAILDVNNAIIKAPFDGVLEQRMLDIGDYANIGDGLLRFISLSPIKVTAFVTEQQKAIITKGNMAKITLVDGTSLEGTISYISSSADPQTRTFEIEVWADNTDNAIAAGLTANIDIIGNSYKAYKVSPAVLTLSDAGVVGVKTVNDNNRVSFNPVTLLTDTEDGIWIKGLPDSIRLVTVGQEFVIDGQEVDAIVKQEEL